ncbi:MAG TPA: hypothetical protein VJI75_05505 [Candidatus Nanoarchaeia archaeon]|nr:hypothetical protein [Candidatus Nanoarchaeia archaeon]
MNENNKYRAIQFGIAGLGLAGIFALYQWDMRRIANARAQLYVAVDTDRNGVLDDAEKRAFAQWVIGKSAHNISIDVAYEGIDYRGSGNFGERPPAPEFSDACASEIAKGFGLERKFARATFHVMDRDIMDRREEVIVYESKEGIDVTVSIKTAEEYRRAVHQKE